MKGRIHSIESFGTVDGPGVRFVVFFQGCPLRCKYCHNPDTWSFGAGEEYTAREIIDKMRRNITFYKTGGITATGGEPMAQMDFLIELFTLAKKEGIHTCLDTSGVLFNESNHLKLEKIDTLLNVCDLVMLDIKHTVRSEHIELTGVSNESPIAFLKYLDKKGKSVRVRHVIVPGITDKREQLEGLGKLLSGIKTLEKLELLPYHTLGLAKYENLGVKYPLEGVPQASLALIKDCYEIIEAKMKK